MSIKQRQQRQQFFHGRTQEEVRANAAALLDKWYGDSTKYEIVGTGEPEVEYYETYLGMTETATIRGAIVYWEEKVE